MAKTELKCTFSTFDRTYYIITYSSVRVHRRLYKYIMHRNGYPMPGRKIDDGMSNLFELLTSASRNRNLRSERGEGGKEQIT